jgi:hypothetical protein
MGDRDRGEITGNNGTTGVETFEIGTATYEPNSHAFAPSTTDTSFWDKSKRREEIEGAKFEKEESDSCRFTEGCPYMGKAKSKTVEDDPKEETEARDLIEGDCEILWNDVEGEIEIGGDCWSKPEGKTGDESTKNPSVVGSGGRGFSGSVEDSSTNENLPRRREIHSPREDGLQSYNASSTLEG